MNKENPERVLFVIYCDVNHISESCIFCSKSCFMLALIYEYKLSDRRSKSYEFINF